MIARALPNQATQFQGQAAGLCGIGLWLRWLCLVGCFSVRVGFGRFARNSLGRAACVGWDVVVVMMLPPCLPARERGGCFSLSFFVVFFFFFFFLFRCVCARVTCYPAEGNCRYIPTRTAGRASTARKEGQRNIFYALGFKGSRFHWTYSETVFVQGRRSNRK